MRLIIKALIALVLTALIALSVPARAESVLLEEARRRIAEREAATAFFASEEFREYARQNPLGAALRTPVPPELEGITERQACLILRLVFARPIIASIEKNTETSLEKRFVGELKKETGFQDADLFRFWTSFEILMEHYSDRLRHWYKTPLRTAKSVFDVHGNIAKKCRRLYRRKRETGPVEAAP